MTTQLSQLIRKLPYTVALLGVAVVVVIGAGFLCERFFDPQSFYSDYYGIQKTQVNYQERPYDCDFDTPPFGNKHCHYKEVVHLYNTNGKPTSVYVNWDRVYD